MGIARPVDQKSARARDNARRKTPTGVRFARDVQGGGVATPQGAQRRIPLGRRHACGTPMLGYEVWAA
eukprot:5111745-Prymnesium_polylepis.1